MFWILDWHHLRFLALSGQRIWPNIMNEGKAECTISLPEWCFSFLHVTSNIVTLSFNVSLHGVNLLPPKYLFVSSRHFSVLWHGLLHKYSVSENLWTCVCAIIDSDTHLLQVSLRQPIINSRYACEGNCPGISIKCCVLLSHSTYHAFWTKIPTACPYFSISI